MINFDNSEIAFRGLSNNDLRKSFVLFKSLGSNTIVQLGKYSTNFAKKMKIPIGWALKPTIFDYFIGGESLENCYKTVRQLEKANVRAILDYSVESENALLNVDAVLEETLNSIRHAASDRSIAFAVFKPSAFCPERILELASAGENLTPKEKLETDLFHDAVDLLCRTAYEKGIPILIDAELSYHQNYVDEIAFEMMAKYNKERAIVYNTLQMYRWDRIAFLEKAHKRAVAENFFYGAKLVRGAYMEKERERAEIRGYMSPIQPDKESTDRDYDAAIRFIMERMPKIWIFLGTHNENSCNYLVKLMKVQNLKEIDPKVWFCQLYGMSNHVSYNLANEGYNVAKYVPYGPIQNVIPYLIRRAEENTSTKGQIGRELSIIMKEMQRRNMKLVF